MNERALNENEIKEKKSNMTMNRKCENIIRVKKNYNLPYQMNRIYYYIIYKKKSIKSTPYLDNN